MAKSRVDRRGSVRHERQGESRGDVNRCSMEGLHRACSGPVRRAYAGPIGRLEEMRLLAFHASGLLPSSLGGIFAEDT